MGNEAIRSMGGYKGDRQLSACVTACVTAVALHIPHAVAVVAPKHIQHLAYIHNECSYPPAPHQSRGPIRDRTKKCSPTRCWSLDKPVIFNNI